MTTILIIFIAFICCLLSLLVGVVLGYNKAWREADNRSANVYDFYSKKRMK